MSNVRPINLTGLHGQFEEDVEQWSPNLELLLHFGWRNTKCWDLTSIKHISFKNDCQCTVNK